ALVGAAPEAPLRCWGQGAGGRRAVEVACVVEVATGSSALCGAMPSRSRLTIEVLTQLGARKLAEPLFAEAARNRQLKQTLNLAVSAKEGPAALTIAPQHDDKFPYFRGNHPHRPGATTTTVRWRNGILPRGRSSRPEV